MHVPCVPFDSLSVKRKENYNKYMTDIMEDIRNGIAGAFAAIELDRSGVNWSPTYHFDKVQPLRVKGPMIFLISLSDLHLPVEERIVHRWLNVPERFRLQGHCGRHVELFKSKRISMRAIGNAFAVPMVASVVLPLVRQAVIANVLTTPRKPRKTHVELWELALAKRRRLR